MKKKVIIIGCDYHAEITKKALQIAKANVNTECVFCVTEPDRGLSIVKLPEPPTPVTFKINNYRHLQEKPQTRSERRKKSRNKKNKR